jgi:hypothetical protein
MVKAAVLGQSSWVMVEKPTGDELLIVTDFLKRRATLT